MHLITPTRLSIYRRRFASIFLTFALEGDNYFRVFSYFFFCISQHCALWLHIDFRLRPLHSSPTIKGKKLNEALLLFNLTAAKKILFTLPSLNRKKSHRQMQLLCSMQKAECCWTDIRERTSVLPVVRPADLFPFTAQWEIRNWKGAHASCASWCIRFKKISCNFRFWCLRPYVCKCSVHPSVAAAHQSMHDQHVH